MATDTDFSDVVLPMLPPTWEWKRLGELVNAERGICYGIVQPGAHDPAGVPMVNTQDVSNGMVNERVEFRVATTLNAKFKRSQLRGGEVLVTLVGANFGRVAVAPDSYAGFNCSRAVGVVPVESDAAFVALALRSPLAQRLMQTWANTTAQPTFNLSDLARLPIALPQKTERQYIAEILTAFDAKIDLHRRMNRTLEDIAQALFRSWFVDFDPVRAKVEGRSPEGMGAETAALFPSGFVGSELGNVPEGWAVRQVGDVITVLGGSTPSTKEPAFWEGGTIPWTTPKDLSGLETHVLLESERRITEQGLASISSGLLPAGAVLLSSRAPIGYVALTVAPTAVNQGFIAMRCEGPLPNHYMLNWTLENMERIKGRANGTTFLEISKSNFRPMPVVVPTPEVLKTFVSVVEPLYARVIANMKESRILADLRDTLLPKLLSGEMRFREAESQLAASV